MLQWLSDHYQPLSLFVNAAMVVIWLTYLQVFLASYREQHQPKILVNRGGSPGLRARCLVSNMSAEAIYVECIIASVYSDDEQISRAVTDVEDMDDEQVRADPKKSTRQGPLQSGGYMDIGSFDSLLGRLLAGRPEASGQQGRPLADVATLEIQVIASYGSETLLVAGRRRFEISGDPSDRRLKARHLSTEQITSRRERKRIAAMLQEHI